ANDADGMNDDDVSSSLFLLEKISSIGGSVHTWIIHSSGHQVTEYVEHPLMKFNECDSEQNGIHHNDEFSFILYE
ncbi:hypothetical protein Tco_1341427, partial [Tanacetum coccineum]